MANYFGSERRRTPRNSQHSFGTVFVKQGSSWMARELLVLDVAATSVRLRAMPDLRKYDFLLQLEGDETFYAAEIKRFERKQNSWEFTVDLGTPMDTKALGGLEVVYDFPRANASR